MSIIIAPLQLLEEHGTHAFQRALDAAAAETPLLSPADTPIPPAIGAFTEKHRAELLHFAGEQYAKHGAGAVYVYDRLDEDPKTQMTAPWAQSYPRTGIGGYLVVYSRAVQLHERGQRLIAVLAGQWSGPDSALLVCATAHAEQPDTVDQLWTVVVRPEPKEEA
jgi:hypothetical protein